MADATSVSAPISGTDKTLSFETGKLALQSPGRRRRQHRRHHRAGHRQRRQGRPRGHRLLPPHRRRRGAGVRRRQDPRLVLPPGGPARPTHAILTCRLIDRPLRPSFPDGFRNETQVVITVIGADQENPHDVLAINARVGRADDLGHPVRRPDRRRAPRLQRRTARGSPHPTYEEGDEPARSSSSSPAVSSPTATSPS